MSNTASEAMRNAVNTVRKSADKAEREFENASIALQSKTSRNIDLFGGHAVSSVADIASEARRICEALYSSCQTLVVILDEKCRPLLDQNPDAVSIREVRDMIEWLNKSSEIENNFTASLNYNSLGDVANIRYYPSLESKMIQSFWETKYDMHPDKEETEKEITRVKKEAEKAEKERKAELAKKRKDQEEEDRINAESEYNRKYEKWLAKAERINSQRDELTSQLMEEATIKRKEKVEKHYSTFVSKANTQLSELQKEKSEAEERMEALKFWQVLETMRLNKHIGELSEEINKVEASLLEAENQYRSDINSIDQWVNKQKKRIAKEVEEKFPLPAKPKKPREYLIVPTGNTPYAIANNALMREIVKGMEEGKQYTIGELMKSILPISDLSEQKVSSLIQMLIEHNPPIVESKKVGKSTRYKLTD
jgi:hypothetical protein